MNLAGCVSMTTFQTAETLNPGTAEIGFAATYFGESEIELALLESETDGKTYHHIGPELMFRIGITENIDIGLKTTGSGTLADGKIQLFSLGSKKTKFILSYQLGIGHNMGIELTNGVLATFRASRSFAIYSSFKYNPLFFYNVLQEDFVNIISAGGGLEIAFDWIVLRPEVTYIKGLSYTLPIEEGTFKGFIPGIMVGFRFD